MEMEEQKFIIEEYLESIASTLKSIRGESWKTLINDFAKDGKGGRVKVVVSPPVKLDWNNEFLVVLWHMDFGNGVEREGTQSVVDITEATLLAAKKHTEWVGSLLVHRNNDEHKYKEEYEHEDECPF